MNSLHSASTEARPLIGSRSHSFHFRQIEGSFYSAANNSGPSLGGGGHRTKNSESVAGIKSSSSGPSSPGPGHKLVTGNNK